MLGKLIKHDLNYSKKSFFSIAAVAVVLSLVAALSVTFDIESISIASLVVIGTVLSVMFVMSIVLIFNGYKKSLFGQNGYLFLTLPVSKNNLLLSKVIGALIWANFMGVVTIIMTTAIVFVGTNLDGTSTYILWEAMPNWLEFIGNALYGILSFNVFTFVAIMVLFMTITLANASFASKRLHWILAGAIGLAYYVIYIRGTVLIGSLLFNMNTNQTSIFEMTLLMIYSILVGGISYFITLRLLKKRIELD